MGHVERSPRWRAAAIGLLVAVVTMGATAARAVPVPAAPGVTWAPLGPSGGFVLAIAASPAYAADRTLYAAAPGGVFVSTDGGSSWTPHAGGLQGQAVSALVVAGRAGGVLLALTDSGGVSASQDGGVSWRAHDAGLAGHTVSALAASPAFATDHTVFAGTVAGALYRSTDAALTWRMVHAPLSGGPAVLALALSPDFARDKTVVAATESGLVASRDAGRTWRSLPTASTAVSAGTWPGFYTVRFSPAYATDHTLYAGGDSLIVSHNRGRSFASLGTLDGAGFLALALSPSFAADGTLVAVAGTASARGAGPAYLSRDRGTTWQALGGLLAGTNVAGVSFSPLYASDHTLFAGAAGAGILASHDGGRTWSAVNQGLYAQVVVSVALSPSYSSDHTLFVAAAGSGMYVSRTGGGYWFPVGGNINGRFDVNSVALSPLFARDHQVFVGAINAYLRSPDSGRTWDMTYANLPGQDVHTVLASPTFSRDHTIVAGGSIGTPGAYRATLFATHDGGATWLEQDDGIEGDIVKAVAYTRDYAANHTLFVGTGPLGAQGALGRLYVSADAAATWRPLGRGFAHLDVLSIAVAPGYPADRTLFAGTSHGLWLSRDAGVTWRRATAGLPGGAAIAALAISPAFETDHTLFAGGPFGVRESVNGGRTWRPVSQALPTTEVLALALTPRFASDHLLLAGTTNSLWLGVVGGGSAPVAPTTVVGLGQQ